MEKKVKRKNKMNNLFDLEGKVSVVTGSSRGLGKALAIGLAEAGSDIVLVDVLDSQETANKIEEAGQKSLQFRTNVRNIGELEKMVSETIEVFGKIDILVNNAGINIIEPSVEVSEENFDKIIDTNLKGTFFCAQAVGKEMIKNKSGKIINISSVNGEFAFPNAAAYNASKAGVIMLTRTLAQEWGKYNINVNAICPGFMETKMLEEIHRDKNEIDEERLEKIPLERFANPEDLIGTVIYLSSEASNYVTGHALFVDGGLSVGWEGVERTPLDSKLREALRENS